MWKFFKTYDEAIKNLINELIIAIQWIKVMFVFPALWSSYCILFLKVVF